MRKLILISFILLPLSLIGQLWSGYIPASRAVDWSGVGDANGNGNGGTCATAPVYITLNASSYAATDVAPAINAAATTIATSGTIQQIKLTAGTFLQLTQIVLKSNVALCGADGLTALDYQGSAWPAITTSAPAVGNALQWKSTNAYASQVMSVPGGTYSGSLAASCNGGAGPSLSKGSDCFSVASTAYMVVKSSTAQPAPLSQPQGFVELSLVDDCNGNTAGGGNPAGCVASNVGVVDGCTQCDQTEQKSYYGITNSTVWTAGKQYHVGDRIQTSMEYIWEVNSIQGSGIAGSATPGFNPVTSPPTLNSTTVNDCNPSPCTGSDTNVITWLAIAIAARTQGQVSRITGVDSTNNVITISPALTTDYPIAREPHATPFGLVQNVTIADIHFLQDLEANGSGTSGAFKNISLVGCYNCTIRGVNSDGAIYLHMECLWCLNLSIINNYLHGSYRHDSGAYGESGISVLSKTTNFLIANNTVIRPHNVVVIEWGVTLGVVAYNYGSGSFHRDNSTVQQDYINHGATPTMILFEGNRGAAFGEDGYWGGMAWITFFRNWALGSSLVCVPGVFNYGTNPNYVNGYINTPRGGVFGQPNVTCSTPGATSPGGYGTAWNIANLNPPKGYWPVSGTIASPNGWNSWWAFHGAYAMNVGPLMNNVNIINNVVGSYPQTAYLYNYSPDNTSFPTLGSRLGWAARVWTFCGLSGVPSPSATNHIYCGAASRQFAASSGPGGYGYTFGYPSTAADSGGGTMSSSATWNNVLIDHDFSYLDYYCLTQTAGPCAADTSNGTWSHNPNQATASFPASFWLAGAPTWASTGFDWPTATIPFPDMGSDVTASSFAATTVKGDPTYNYHLPAGCMTPAECVYNQLGGGEGGAGDPLVGWSESLYNSGAPSTFTLTIASPTGTVTSSPSGISNCYTGTPSSGVCAASFSSGSTPSLTATPSAGYTVNDWTGANSACTGLTSCSVTMSADKIVTVNYSAIPTHNLTLNGGSHGSISPTPSGASCGTNCFTYAQGTGVTLQANPAAGYTFSGWSGDCSGTSNPCVVIMSADRSATATFTQVPVGSVPAVNGGVQINGGVAVH